MTGNFDFDFDLGYLTEILFGSDNENVKTELSEDRDSIRFGKAVSDEDMKNLIDGQKYANTDKNTRWAVGVFNAWRNERGAEIPDLITMILVLDLLWSSSPS